MENERESGEAKFAITDDRSAEWALRKIREIYAERDRLVELCNLEIEAYNEKIEAFDKKADSDATYLKLLLAEYFATVPHKATKTQESYRLPSGTLRLKRPAPEDRRDEALLMHAFPEFVENRPSFQWAEFKKTLRIEEENGKKIVVCAEDGQVVPETALQLIERAPEFVVEVK